MKHPPLKRHEGLQPLSRDHYAGLVQAKHLRHASEADEAQRRLAIDEFLLEWRDVISEHFDDEENLLLPLIRDDEPRRRLLDEHAALRTFAKQAESMRSGGRAPTAEWLAELSELLHDHIRWEERELFPLIEQSAGAEALDMLERETTVIEQTRPRWRDRKQNRS